MDERAARPPGRDRRPAQAHLDAHACTSDRTGRVAVDAYSVAGDTHNLAFDEPGVDQLAIQFFGLAVPLTSLRNLASKVGLRFGTAVNTDALASNAKYAQIPPTSSPQ